MAATGAKKSPARAGGSRAAKTISRTGAKKTSARSAGRTAKNSPKPGAAKIRAVATKNPPARRRASPGAGGEPAVRYKCRLCGYIYSPLRGEPHNGIPRGTPFEDLPDTYVCPVCGQDGKGKIGKWGFEEWRPTRYLCTMCNYVYDEKRGEPHRGIKPGTKFEDLPDDYACPVCAQDPKMIIGFGKVLKNGFEPLDY